MDSTRSIFAMLVSTILGVIVISAESANPADVASLVQARLTFGNSSEGRPSTRLRTQYRLRILKTHGAGHVCFTEIELIDSTGERMSEVAEDVSSCWGCAVSCRNCSVDYGDLRVLSDGVADNSSGSDYFCTNFGGFTNDGDSGSAIGEQHFVWSLKERPARLNLRYGAIKGKAFAKDFVFEELNEEGDWQLLSSATDADISSIQAVNVQTSTLAGKWWLYTDPACLKDSNGTSSEALTLDYSGYKSDPNASFKAVQQGAFVDGAFGYLTMPDGGTYDAFQINFRFPSQRTVGEKGQPAMGEMHIVHQKTSHSGMKGMLIVVVPLQLPAERDAASKTSDWFNELCLPSLPLAGAPRELATPVDLRVFNEQLDGSAMEQNCTKPVDGVVDSDVPTWIVLQRPASVQGVVVQEFRKNFPFETLGDTAEPETITRLVRPNATEIIAASFTAAPTETVIDEIFVDGVADDTEIEVAVAADDTEVDTEVAPPVGETKLVLRWKANPEYGPDTVEYTSKGEWTLVPVPVEASSGNGTGA